MIIKKIAFGDSREAFIEERLTGGLNIIFSDDNNKGKTIVMQSSLYSLGNEPIFPTTFSYKDYYHYVEIELDNGDLVKVCRKGDSFIVKTVKGLCILDSVSELKRCLSRCGMLFPVILKDNSPKIVDPVLLYQVFFVGQDKKDSSTIFNAGYYKKEDFWNLVYSIAGVNLTNISEIDSDEIKKRIAELEEERKVLLEKNKILKKPTPTMEFISQKQANAAFEDKVKKLESIRNRIIELQKNQNRALQRKTINEKTLSEIRSLNKTPISGDLYCLDCGSKHIGYLSGDKSYSFDISDTEMRKNISRAIEDKISTYQEEIESSSFLINNLQRQMQDLLKEKEINLERVLAYKSQISDLTESDTRIAVIDHDLKVLRAKKTGEKAKSQIEQKRMEEIRNEIINAMNQFYNCVDPSGTLVFDDLFSKRLSVYSGCEATEFFLSKLYALAVVLSHKFPIMMDYFRDGELSTEKEKVVIQKFGQLKNQTIFTATLKEQELGKYSSFDGVNAIDYSINKDSHILDSLYNSSFRKLLKDLMIDL